ncbi:MAG: hypothetical protein NXY57DRAFT_966079 [Lentinula lateritia]|nr:MAG: hypothetical protein NXY57DRAFT_966079 [Lentinula lateritia]
MVDNSDSSLPKTSLSSFPDRSDHPAPFTGADASFKTPHPVVVDNPVEARSQYMFEIRRQCIHVTRHRDSVSLKHMELLEQLKFEDTIDDEAEVVSSRVVNLPWSSPYISQLFNNLKSSSVSDNVI